MAGARRGVALPRIEVGVQDVRPLYAIKGVGGLDKKNINITYVISYIPNIPTPLEGVRGWYYIIN